MIPPFLLAKACNVALTFLFFGGIVAVVAAIAALGEQKVAAAADHSVDPTLLWQLSLDDDGRVIDARVRGNAARWINHSCDPNCETEETDDGRVFIQAMRDIRRGEELNYDYGLIIDERYTPKLKAEYPCWCGATQCRSTLLAPKRRR